MLAEFLAAVMNPSAAGGDHAAIYAEHCVIRWLMELIDFPTDGNAGILVGGGSVASLYCLAVARHWAAAKFGWNMREQGLQGNHPPLVLYISEEGHSCLGKGSHLLVQVETTVASVCDVDCTTRIQQDLRERELAPSEQLVDSGYVSGRTLRESRAAAIDLIGPALPDSSWQGRAAAGFAVADFAIDWQGQQARCPAGQVSSGWHVQQDAAGEEHLTVTFARTVCQACPLREQCTHSQQKGRLLHLQAQPIHEALQPRRAEQGTPEFQRRYATRAGVEGTLSQGVRVMGLRRSRYLGQDKTHLQHVATAAAINLARIDAYLTCPAPPPRPAPRFAQLREKKLA